MVFSSSLSLIRVPLRYEPAYTASFTTFIILIIALITCFNFRYVGITALTVQSCPGLVGINMIKAQFNISCTTPTVIESVLAKVGYTTTTCYSCRVSAECTANNHCLYSAINQDDLSNRCDKNTTCSFALIMRPVNRLCDQSLLLTNF